VIAGEACPIPAADGQDIEAGRDQLTDVGVPQAMQRAVDLQGVHSCGKVLT
jgi:hypothetical protein